MKWSHPFKAWGGSSWGKDEGELSWDFAINSIKINTSSQRRKAWGDKKALAWLKRGVKL